MSFCEGLNRLIFHPQIPHGVFIMKRNINAADLLPSFNSRHALGTRPNEEAHDNEVRVRKNKNRGSSNTIIKGNDVHEDTSSKSFNFQHIYQTLARQSQDKSQ